MHCQRWSNSKRSFSWKLLYKNRRRYKKITNVEPSIFKFIFLVTLFHYVHLAEMGIDFSLKSILEDYKILRQFDSECALKVMFMIGRKVTGNQLKDLKQQKNETEFEPLK